jgi:hypothetical protein
MCMGRNWAFATPTVSSKTGRGRASAFRLIRRLHFPRCSHRPRAMPPPAGLAPWPTPSSTPLATPNPARPPPRVRVRPPHPTPPPPPYTRVRLPPPAPTPPPKPRPKPAAPNPSPASTSTPTPPPPATTSAASSSSTCLDCVHFGKYDLSHIHSCTHARIAAHSPECELIFHLPISRCSGCTSETDLDKPPVLQEVASFFEGHGIGDFTFSRGRLVITVTRLIPRLLFFRLAPIFI